MKKPEEIPDIVRIPARIDPEQIGYANFIIGQHEGMGEIRTEDPVTGKILVCVQPHDADLARQILNEIADEIDLRWGW
jgi:hypothetical protein